MTESEWVTVGRIRTAFGVKGWLKVESFTQPADNLLDYDDWRLASSEKANRIYEIKVDEINRRQSDILVRFKGVDDRDSARQFANHLIQVPKSRLPELEPDDFYWHELEGLQVYQVDWLGNKSFLVGVVDSILETGANDVLLVKRQPDASPAIIGCVNNTAQESAIDADSLGPCESLTAMKATEVLIPYLPEQVVKRVDTEHGEILVDWYYDED